MSHYILPSLPHTHTHKRVHTHTHTHTNKQSLVDYYVLSHEIQVIAFFLPEAPTEMFKLVPPSFFNYQDGLS